ncbi:MAG: deoxyribose-phosphate aldolase [Bryobacteraceae bacterium]|jgi:deoxyribose-phosphate aldolase
MENAELEQIVAAIAEGLLAQKGAPAEAAHPSQPGGSPEAPPFDASIAALIDHTILRPDATADEIRQVCAEARQYGFASVCVNPARVALAAAELRGCGVKVCSVAGFPLGAAPTEAKMLEAELAMRAGAQEIDMVIHIGALKERDYRAVKNDVQSVARLCHAGVARLKVIIEACLLDDAEKVAACALAKLAGADFVKTSTGFAKAGATAADVALMRRVVGPEMGVKAAGGIRTLEDLRAMVEAGATRIGASASVKIMEAASR